MVYFLVILVMLLKILRELYQEKREYQKTRCQHKEAHGQPNDCPSKKNQFVCLSLHLFRRLRPFFSNAGDKFRKNRNL